MARCLSVIASFSPTSNGFLKLVTDFFMWRYMHSSMRSEKAGGHPDKILVSWDVSVYEVSQEVPVASLFLSLKDPGHDPGVWWLSSSADTVVVAVGQVMVLSSSVSFFVFPSRCKSKY